MGSGMNLRTFSAGTMAEALLQVKQELGSDAVILHTRTYQQRRWLGLRKQEVVEITAGSGLKVGSRKKPPATGEGAPQPGQQQRLRAPSVNVRRTPVMEEKPAPVAAATMEQAMSGPRQLLNTPAASGAMMIGLSDEVSSLKAMVMDLVRETRSSKAPQVPEELFEHYRALIENKVTEELAGEVMKNLRASMRPEHLRNADFVRDRLADQLEKMLPVAGPITRTKSVGPHVVALIGPTGVGKTTTLAKLAANLKLRESRKIGLITIDTYRIAAVDQLKKYADIIGSPFKVVGSPEELAAAVHSMRDCDFVLIDTAGRSPTDSLKLQELRNFLKAAKPDEVHLVLSTTASQSCMESAIARFGEVGCDKIIFTKLDEAVQVGVVFNVIRKVNKALSYVTTGQDVPDDIEVGRGKRLAQLILGGKL
jgi:flagellar biosynthesis protein FlhF